MTINSAMTFTYNMLPKAMKQLIAHTGKRPSKVHIVFQEGATEVSTRWGRSPVMVGATKLIGEEHRHGFDSAGESYTDTTWRFNGPVARDTTPVYSGAKSEVTVYLGNLGELCPTREALEAVAVDATPALLAQLWEVAHRAQGVVPAKVELVEVATPHCFNDLTENKEVGRSVLVDGKWADVDAPAAARNEHLDALAQMGIE